MTFSKVASIVSSFAAVASGVKYNPPQPIPEITDGCVMTEGQCWTPSEDVIAIVMLEYCATHMQRRSIDSSISQFFHRKQGSPTDPCIDVKESDCHVDMVGQTQHNQIDDRFAKNNQSVRSRRVYGSYNDVERAITVMFQIAHDHGVSNVDALIKINSLEPASFLDQLANLRDHCFCTDDKDTRCPKPEQKVFRLPMETVTRLDMFQCRKTGPTCWNPNTIVNAQIDLWWCLEDCFKQKYKAMFNSVMQAHFKGNELKDVGFHFENEHFHFDRVTFAIFFQLIVPLFHGAGHNLLHLNKMTTVIQVSTEKVKNNAEMLKDFMKNYLIRTNSQKSSTEFTTSQYGRNGSANAQTPTH